MCENCGGFNPALSVSNTLFAYWFVLAGPFHFDNCYSSQLSQVVPRQLQFNYLILHFGVLMLKHLQNEQDCTSKTKLKIHSYALPFNFSF